MKKTLLTTILGVATLLSAVAQSTGFYTNNTNGNLLDACGNNFIMKGMNVPLAWYVSNVNGSIAALKTNTKSNCLRIVVQENTPDASWQTTVTNCINNGIIPMVELHDVTGSTDAAALKRMGDFWAARASYFNQPNIKKHILINLANEWGTWQTATNKNTVWRDAVIAAIKPMRTAGITTTIVIDAVGYGQDIDDAYNIRTYAKDIQRADNTSLGGPSNSTEKANLLFSVHMYCEWKKGGDNIAIVNTIKTSGIPIIVGEFGYQHATDGSCDIDEQGIMNTCQAGGVGWLAWSQKGNGSPVEYLDLCNDWACTQLSSWGNTIINGTNGTKTAVQCSVFSSSGCGTTTTNPTPTVTISAPVTGAKYCVGSSITINATASISSGSISKVDFYDGTTLLGSDNSSPYSYVWNNASSGTKNIRAIATSALNVASQAASIDVVVQAVPVMGAYLQVNGGTWTNTSTAELCAGGTVSFGPHPYDVETGWTWTGPANFTAATREITLSNLAANKSGTYVATFSNGTCSAKQNFTLTINALPVATVTAPSTSFCTGSSLTISSSNATSYVWKKGVDQVATTQTYNVTSAGSYTVEVTDAKGCKGVSGATQITQTTASIWYADTDGDGFGDANSKMEACTKPTGYVSNSTDQCPTDVNKTVAGNCGCGKTEQSCLDCNGTPNGTAITDNCGRCVGGTTSKQACTAKIEAELACDFNGVVENNNVGFLGTGFVNTTNAINSSVAVVLNVTQAGNYTIGYRYALGGTTARGATVLVNRIDQKTMTFAPTGAFTTYGTEEVSLSLKAGDNIVRLASLTTAGTANIDLIYWNSAAISEAANCDLVTGLGETEFENSNWKVYPNPFTNTFLISKEGVQAEYKIFSIKGELVQSGVLDNSVVLGEGLSSGVYELKLIEADKVSSLKLIKQ